VPLVTAEVDESQIMFKKTVWRRMNLTQRQNRPFFSKNGEITKLLIEAVDKGLLTPYRTDSCVNFMPDITFNSNISIETGDNPFVGGGFAGGGFGDEDQEEQSEEDQGPQTQRIPASVFTVLYLREELIFDRNRSRMYPYIRAITLALPADAGTTYNPQAFEKKLAHFRYDDVIDLFKTEYKDIAIYYNNQNQATHVNMADAFELRLFNAPITRISNSEGTDIRQEYDDPFQQLIIQQKYENDLMEYESELWEY
jgi:gliding motility associated protien GldN